MKVFDLSIGTYGPEVNQLQQQLQQRGYDVSSSEVARSFFGPSTRVALLRWQRDRGLKPSGALDDGTSAALTAPTPLSSPSSPSTTAAPPAAGPTPNADNGSPVEAAPRALAAAMGSTSSVISSPGLPSVPGAPPLQPVRVPPVNRTVSVHGQPSAGALSIPVPPVPPITMRPAPAPTARKDAPTASDSTQAPQLTLKVDPNVANQSVGPAAGISVTVSGYVEITGLPAWDTNHPYTMSTPSVTVQFSQKDGTLLGTPFQFPVNQWYYPVVNTNSSRWQWILVTPVGGDIDVLVKASIGYIGPDGSPNTTVWSNQQTVSLTAVDVTFEVDQPQDGQVFDGSSGGSSGFYVLSASGMTSESGTSSSSPPLQITSVTWQGDWTTGPPASGTASTSDGFAHWSAYIQLPLGTSILTFAVAVAGGQTARIVQRTVQVALRADIFDLEPLSYLRALIEFGTQRFNSDGSARVITSPGSPAQSLTTDLIDQEFYQGLGEILDGQNQVSVSKTVYQTRICIEVLRRYLLDKAVLTFQLTVTDSSNATANAAVDVTVYGRPRNLLVDAGPNQTVNQGTLVTLEAGSLDSIVGTTVRFQWTQIGGPPVTLNNPTSSVPSFTAPALTLDTVLTFELVATDSANNTSTARVNVTVYGTTHLLIANGGASHTVNQGSTIVLGVSPKPGAAALTYQWTQIGGPPVTLNNANTATPYFVTTLAAQLQALQAAESAYRQAAYFSLLNQIGSSYDEIRMARTYDRNDAKDRKKLQAICDLLGIELGSRLRFGLAVAPTPLHPGPPIPIVLKDDHLDQLFVDPGPTGSLTERYLEEMFGLVDTTRDSFSQGATITTLFRFITRWNLEGAEWNRATDPDGIVYVTIDKITIPPLPRMPPRIIYQVTLFSDSGRTKSLATGQIDVNGHALLKAVGSSGVSGRLMLAYPISAIPSSTVFPYRAAFSVFPRFLSWQFQRLRSAWVKEDFPDDTVLSFQLTATDNTGATATAAVDVNVSHINRPLVAASTSSNQQPISPGANVTLSVITATPSISNGTISSYQWSQQGGGPTVTLNGAQTASASFVAPSVTADTVLTFQLTVTDSNSATATVTVNVTVSSRNAALTVDTGPSQCVIEGTAVTLAGKAADSNTAATITYQWTQTAGPPVTLVNANSASVSFTAPTNAPWPIIDPDLLINGDFKHLQEPPYSSLYVNRQKQVQSWSLKSWGPPLAGFNGMLRAALGGNQLGDLEALDQQSQNGTNIAPQLEAMGLSRAAFYYILRLGALVKGGQPLLDSELGDLVSILIQVQKIKQGVPTWRSEESIVKLSLSPDFFNYPPALPTLFATGVDENGITLPDGAQDNHWSIIRTPSGQIAPAVATNAANNAPPIGIDWMRNTPTSRWISPQADESQGSLPGSYTYRTNIDLRGYDPDSVRLTLRVAVDHDLTSVLLNGKDLGVKATGSAGFTTLEINGPFQAGANTLDLVVNSVGFHGVPTARSGLHVELNFTAPPQMADLPAWRAALQVRQKWQDTLRGRIEQDNALVEALTAGVDVTEKQSLGPLRDALVQTLPVSPDWLSQRLLIDVQADTAEKTTRLTQATEMMQALFFALRNHEFQQLSPLPDVAPWNLSEGLGQFDQEWDSMGSYSNWAALSLVFLYPENLLLPTLRLDPPSSSGGAPQAVEEQTQAFKDFASRLSNYSGMLTPDAAVREANNYLSNGLNAKDSGGKLNYSNLPDELNEGKTTARYVDPRSANVAGSILSANNALYGYAQNQNWPGVAYIWEACYFVPVQIGLELQKAQQFEAALAWFHVVYAYDLPVTRSDMRRRLFPGLLTESRTSSYAQPPTWTITFSNPHQIAAPPAVTASDAIARACPYTRFTYLSIMQCLLDFADAQFGSETAESLSNARALYRNVLDLLTQLPEILPTDAVTASNPRAAAMRRHAENNLRKLRTGRNIAGMSTPIQASTNGATSIQPSGYRYSALVDRAKQLVTLAQQIEGSYLASLQKGDDEAYSALRASQDLESANASAKLEKLKVTEANDSVTLAFDQQQRAQIQVNHYNDLLSSDIVLLETLSIVSLAAEAVNQSAAAGLSGAAAGLGAYSAKTFLESGANILQNLASAATSLAGFFGTNASILSVSASLEEKLRDWNFQLQLANEDVTIGQDQVQIANDNVAIANQDLSNATMQANHARATANFLATKFTNADLYRWMSGVLGGVYAYFLRQATAVARLAETQLAFERQETALSVIQSDYWQPLSNATGGSSSGGQSPDRAGLTGAERLLGDITQLDQFAFATDKRKLQLTKTISLAQLDPVSFQKFVQTGVLRFDTPMDVFDRDFPGQYLRMIKQVRVSVVALIPPTQGIRATLANDGISHVITQDDSGNFQPVTVRRDPQLIALTSPANATGLFNLIDSQSNLLLPFEDLGVDTSWEFMMPQAANPFDYTTIADVLLAIDYTALDSPDFRKQVVQQLDQSVSVDRAYSFRQQFADAWYDLNNPDQSSSPMVVQFRTQTTDFPPNVSDMNIAQLVLYFVSVAGVTLSQQPTAKLTLAGTDANGNPKTATGSADAMNNVISTRRGNAASWIEAMVGMEPAGNWTLDLSTPGLRSLFQSGQLQDILFVITYNGRLPAWPT